MGLEEAVEEIQPHTLESLYHHCYGITTQEPISYETTVPCSDVSTAAVIACSVVGYKKNETT